MAPFKCFALPALGPTVLQSYEELLKLDEEKKRVEREMQQQVVSQRCYKFYESTMNPPPNLFTDQLVPDPPARSVVPSWNFQRMMQQQVVSQGIVVLRGVFLVIKGQGMS